jgi:hypothetical protein
MSLINWSAVSQLLAGNKDSIREHRRPVKYTKQIELIKRYEGYMLKELEQIKG